MVGEVYDERGKWKYRLPAIFLSFHNVFKSQTGQGQDCVVKGEAVELVEIFQPISRNGCFLSSFHGK